jgi:hypothetical protein
MRPRRHAPSRSLGTTCLAGSSTSSGRSRHSSQGPRSGPGRSGCRRESRRRRAMFGALGNDPWCVMHPATLLPLSSFTRHPTPATYASHRDPRFGALHLPPRLMRLSGPAPAFL